ncbi:hypothetical protein C2G38_2102285 [Gigaspora rosea]|uniref:G-protein coupled receptors family 1 profile domain-containing protein n=1 Tax=Gigaspora rosea TaxID=44941 RepID=A0A397UWJ8_9GLOM|nr:hypothetical protein C2G38_2102285 [Gigaspora rosea]
MYNYISFLSVLFMVLNLLTIRVLYRLFKPFSYHRRLSILMILLISFLLMIEFEKKSPIVYVHLFTDTRS